MTWEQITEILYIPEIFISTLLGTAIGLEREIRGKDPSLRTFAFVCLGSCVFGLVSKFSVVGVPSGDPSRIAAQIVTGIGFLGVGTIFRSPRGVTGLTTAALMWVTAAIGVAVSFDRIDLAVITTLYAIAISFALNILHDFILLVRRIGGATPAGSTRKK